MGRPAVLRLVGAPSCTVPTAAVARVLGAVHVAAPLLTLLWFAFPHASGVRLWPLVGFLFAGVALGLALLSGFADAWPRWRLSVVLAVATLLVTVAALLVGPAHREFLLFYLWTTPLAFCLLSLPGAVAQVGWLAVCVTVGLVAQGSAPVGPRPYAHNLVAVALLVVGTALVLGLLVRWLTLLVGQRDAALDVTRARLQAIVDGAPITIFAIDTEGTITLSQGAGLRERGLNPADRVGRSAFTEYVAAPAVLDALRRALCGETLTTEAELDGSVLRTALRPLHDATGAVVGATGISVDVTAIRRAEEQVRGLAEERRHLLAALVSAQESERRRIARDIHDDSLQVMAVVDLRLQLIRRRLVHAADAEVLDRVSRALQEATERLRLLLFDLEPPTLARAGLAEALRDYLEAVFADASVRWQVVESDAPDLPPATRTILYRIAQEALANVRKHATASEVVVEIRGTSPGVELIVRDDGIGVDPIALLGRPGHLGLAGMRERAEVAGGRWRIERATPRGTQVACWLPVEDRPVASSPHAEATGRSLSSAEPVVR